MTMIPTPRKSDTLNRVDGRWLSAYREALDDLNRWTLRRTNRISALQRHYDRRGKDATSAGFLIDQDQEVREAQIMIDRAAARAAALGAAAVLESQGVMR